MGAKKFRSIVLDKEITRMVVSAVEDTFNSMFGVQFTLDQTLHNHPVPSGHYISGIVGFIEDSIDGTLSIRMSRELAIELANKALGSHSQELDDKVVDWLAEVTSITYGLVKNFFNDEGYQLKPCFPIVVLGQNHTIFAPIAGPNLIARFKSEYGAITTVFTLNIKAR